MKNPKTITVIGAILLMVGAMMPWATVSGIFGISQSIYGYQGDGIFTGLAGFVILILALNSKETPGKNYSNATTIIALLSGLLLLSKIFGIFSVMSEQAESVSMSMGIGLSCLSPLGIALAIVGGSTRIPSTPSISAIEEPITKPRQPNITS